MGRRIVLASTSTYRATLLRRLGLPFEAMAPDYDEENAPDANPADLVLEQAEGKAASLLGCCPDALIIGSDQIVHLDGEILTKPGNFAGAVAQLVRLSGREHELLTAVVVFDPESGRRAQHLERSTVRVRQLTQDEIEAYVVADEPYDCAGAYKAESLGVAIFDYQRGDDPTAVIGLPLIALTRLLRELGLDVFEAREREE